MTGFTDEFYNESLDLFRKHEIPQPKSYYVTSPALVPHMWVEPFQVWEIAAADFTRSPVHMAGIHLVCVLVVVFFCVHMSFKEDDVVVV